MAVTAQQERIVSERRLETYRAADALWRAEPGDDVRWLEHELICRALAWAAELHDVITENQARDHLANMRDVVRRALRPGPTQLPVQHRALPEGTPPATDLNDPDTYPPGVREVPPDAVS